MLFCVSKTPSCAARTAVPVYPRSNVQRWLSVAGKTCSRRLTSMEIAGLIPGAELVLVEDCGHLSTMECPEEINAALRNWTTC